MQINFQFSTYCVDTDANVENEISIFRVDDEREMKNFTFLVVTQLIQAAKYKMFIQIRLLNFVRHLFNIYICRV